MNKQQIIRFSNVKESSKTIAFLNYNDFIKKYRALRIYCPRSYKYICFKVLPNLKIISDGEYTIDIPTDPVFAEVYGKIKLHYDVTGGKLY